MATQENNNGLYFIVGALVVIVAVIGFLYVENDNTEITNIDPAAGIEETADNIEDSTTEFNVDVEDDGFSASTETQSEGN